MAESIGTMMTNVGVKLTVPCPHELGWKTLFARDYRRNNAEPILSEIYGHTWAKLTVDNRNIRITGYHGRSSTTTNFPASSYYFQYFKERGIAEVEIIPDKGGVLDDERLNSGILETLCKMPFDKARFRLGFEGVNVYEIGVPNLPFTVNELYKNLNDSGYMLKSFLGGAAAGGLGSALITGASWLANIHPKDPLETLFAGAALGFAGGIVYGFATQKSAFASCYHTLLSYLRNDPSADEKAARSILRGLYSPELAKEYNVALAGNGRRTVSI